MPENLGIHQGRLTDCPESPNCVSTEAREEPHKVEPFRLKGNPKDLWPKVVNVVSALPRTKVLKATDDYVHAECRSRLFRFVDDLELYLKPAGHFISIRSASRLGKSDFGVNRKRVELLREMMRAKGLIE